MVNKSDYDEFEKQKYASPLDQINQRERMVKENFLVTIILALTLNLVADFLWSFEQGITYSGLLLLIGAILLTIVVLVLLARLRFEDVKKLNAEYQTTVVWDTLTGQFPELPYKKGYSPQNAVNILMNALDQSKRTELEQTLKSATPPEGFTTDLLIELLFHYIRRSPRFHRMLPGACFLTEIQGYEYKHLLVPLAADEIVITIPGNFDMEFKQLRHSTRIIINWKNNYEGRITITLSSEVSKASAPRFVNRPSEKNSFFGMPLSSEQDFVDTRGKSVVDYDITLEAEFSPFYLLMNWGRSRQLLEWSKNLLDYLRDIMDWEYWIYKLTTREFQY